MVKKGAASLTDYLPWIVGITVMVILFATII